MKRLQVNKEIELTKELLEINKKRVAQIDEDIKNIEERYKALMNKELSSLTTERANRIATIKAMDTLFNLDKNTEMAAEAPATQEEAMPEQKKEAEKKSEPESKPEPDAENKEEEEPVIKDTLFPENNEPETENEAEPEVAIEEQSEVDSNEGAEQSASEEQAVPDVVDGDASGFDFGNEEQSESPASDDDDWAQMPQEWQ